MSWWMINVDDLYNTCARFGAPMSKTLEFLNFVNFFHIFWQFRQNLTLTFNFKLIILFYQSLQWLLWRDSTLTLWFWIVNQWDLTIFITFLRNSRSLGRSAKTVSRASNPLSLAKTWGHKLHFGVCLIFLRRLFLGQICLWKRAVSKFWFDPWPWPLTLTPNVMMNYQCGWPLQHMCKV